MAVLMKRSHPTHVYTEVNPALIPGNLAEDRAYSQVHVHRVASHIVVYLSISKYTISLNSSKKPNTTLSTLSFQ